MTKKKRGPTLEEILQRPWCYYCERDFDDMMVLTSHQKAKHFKCDRCGRRLNTAGGLSVHMNQVHKENLSAVENALPNRQDPGVEIFGVEGIPENVTTQHQQRVIAQYHEQAAERRAATGNPPPGSGPHPPKRTKREDPVELKKRLNEYREKVLKEKSNNLPGAEGLSVPLENGVPPGQPYHMNAAPPGVAAPGLDPFGNSRPPTQSNATAGPPGTAMDVDSGLNSRDPRIRARSQRNQVEAPANATSVDELVSNAAQAAPTQAESSGQTEKRSSRKDKEKMTKLVYEDNEVTPEEKMARMARFAFDPAIRKQPSVVGNAMGAPVTGVASGPDRVMDAQG